MAARTKHRSAASSTVNDFLKRAERRINDKYQDEVNKLVDVVKKENQPLINKFKKLNDEIDNVVKELYAVGLQHYSGRELVLKNPTLMERSKPAQKLKTERLEKLQTLELDIMMFGVADDVDLQTQTKALIEKINAIVGE